jgi:hypothetical protein
MTKARQLFFLLTLSLVFQSCNYRWVRVETTDGKKVRIKEYKDYKVAEMKRDLYFFKYDYHEQTYPKYSGIITSDTIRGSAFIQFDSIRVYLNYGTSKYKSIFSSGLVSGQMIYCAMDSSCKPVNAALVMVRSSTGDTIVENLWGWTGHTIQIDHFEELKYVNSKSTQRRFKFWVYPGKVRFNGGNDIFFLELTNDKADETTDIDDFIKGARVTFIKKAWWMML